MDDGPFYIFWAILEAIRNGLAYTPVKFMVDAIMALFCISLWGNMAEDPSGSMRSLNGLRQQWNTSYIVQTLAGRGFPCVLHCPDRIHIYHGRPSLFPRMQQWLEG